MTVKRKPKLDYHTEELFDRGTATQELCIQTGSLLTKMGAKSLFVIFTSLWANSADDRLTQSLHFFPENSLKHFMQIVC